MQVPDAFVSVFDEDFHKIPPVEKYGLTSSLYRSPCPGESSGRDEGGPNDLVPILFTAVFRAGRWRCLRRSELSDRLVFLQELALGDLYRCTDLLHSFSVSAFEVSLFGFLGD